MFLSIQTANKDVDSTKNNKSTMTRLIKNVQKTFKKSIKKGSIKKCMLIKTSKKIKQC